MSKYERLGEFLRRQPRDEVPMTFDRIEKVTGEKLPPSARRYRAWWSNNAQNSVMTRVWLDAGFQSEQVDLEGHHLLFRRIRSTGRKSDVPAGSAGRHPLIGSLKGVIRISPGTDLTAPADPEWGDRAQGS